MNLVSNNFLAKLVFVVACVLVGNCATSDPQSNGHSTAPVNSGTEQLQLTLRVTNLKQRVQHLEQELAEQQFQLMKMQSDLLPSPKPAYIYPAKAAKVNFITGDFFGVNRGKKNGIRRGDHLVVFHRTETGLYFKGQGMVYEVVDDELNAVGVNFGYAPGDEVYICNRDDAQNSLSNIVSK